MNTVAVINTYLSRPLKSGRQFDRYFSKSPCKSTFLTKGTTTDGLKQMVNWVKKHQHQTIQLSKKLKGKNVATTVTNIYDFLYNHLQYSADGLEQNLRSPKCSWQTRQIGIDCKSYSVFASCILSNLKIPHAFRKVKQPSNPERWSHVYIVVFHNNKELIIDATKAENTEVKYIYKEDMPVEQKLSYYGLNAAQPTITDEQRASDLVISFREFLRRLNSENVSVSITDRIEYLVKKSLGNSIDPKLTFLEDKAIINNDTVYYETTLEVANGLNAFDFGSVTGIFSSLFGPEDRASVLAKADVLVKTDINKAINIANTQGKAAAISFVDGLISHNRKLAAQYTSDNSIAKHTKMANDFENFKNQLLSGSYNQAPVTTTPYNPNVGGNSGLNINDLVQVGVDLFKDSKTGQTYTSQQLQSNPPPPSKTYNNQTKDNTLNYVLIGAAFLAAGSVAYVAINNSQNNKQK